MASKLTGRWRIDSIDLGISKQSTCFDLRSSEPVNTEGTHIYRKLKLPDSEIRILLQEIDDQDRQSSNAPRPGDRQLRN